MAAHDTLAALFPSQRPRFAALLADDLSRIPACASEGGRDCARSPRGRSDSTLRANDGSDHPENRSSGSTFFPEQQAREMASRSRSARSRLPSAHDGGWHPLVIASATQFRAPRPPMLDSVAYAVAFDEVKALGSDGVTRPRSGRRSKLNPGIYWAYDGLLGCVLRRGSTTRSPRKSRGTTGA